jgi:hypothetical protein
MPSWYIDSWSILDGIAFASLRDPWNDAPTLAPAQTTVMIAPPDWRAVSIARLSTALAATRGGFQEGLYSDNDNEVEFPSLAIVRSVVRRAYLAGGVGIDASGGEGIAAVPEGNWPRGGGGSQWTKVRGLLLNPKAGAEVATVRDELVSLITRDVDHLWDLLRQLSSNLSDATGRTWISSTGEDRFRDRQDQVGFERLNFQLGLHAPRWLPTPFWPEAWPGTPAPRQHLRLLLRMPAARQFPGYPRVNTIADQLFLVSASRVCFDQLRTMQDLLPILFAGVVIAANGGLYGDVMPDYKAMVLERTAIWLSELVPERLQDEDGAERVDLEELLEELIVRIVQLRSGSGPVSTPGGGVPKVADDPRRTRGPKPGRPTTPTQTEWPDEENAPVRLRFS